MGMTVKQMLSVMDSHELTEHMIDYRLEPWGEHRADLRAGIIAAVINNVNASDKKHLKKPSDFMPFFEDDIDDDETVGEKLAKALKRYGNRNT